MKRINIPILIISLIIPLLVGGISAALSAQGMVAYGAMNKPPLSPPPWVFSVAWTILYILMGLSMYCVFMGKENFKVKTAFFILYGIQLFLNFMWSIIFFNWNMYLVACIVLIVMWCLVITCAFKAYQVSHAAAFLLIPYILWLTFAGYLNIGSYILAMRGR